MTMQASPADIEFSEKFLKLAKKVASPFMSGEKRTQVFAEFVNSLSDDTFMVYRDKILDKINPSRESAKKFKTTEEQVKDIISRIPRLELVKDDLTAKVKQARKDYGVEG